MIKDFLKLILIYLLFINISYANSFKWNKIYQGGDYKLNRVSFNLPEGEWLLLSVNDFDIKGISLREIIYVKEKDNLLTDIYEISVLNSYGNFISSIDSWIQEVFFSRNQHDGCFEKDEYYLVRVKRRSASLNCFVVYHNDTNKEIWHPDKNPNGIIKSFNNSWVRKWVSDKKIVIPKTMITSGHFFYDKRVGMHVVLEGHSINPEFYGAKKTKFHLEEQSEYHKFNIDKHPEAKNYMESFIKQAILNHKQFENYANSKDDFKLDLSEFDVYTQKKINVKSSKLVNQLNDLKKLFDEGVLTQEEFTKAKKKLLN